MNKKQSMSIHSLMKRQKAYQKAIMVMQNKLNQIQSQMSEMLCDEYRKAEHAVKTSDVLTKKEVCNMLGVSESTLYRMRLNKDFPFRRIKGCKNLLFSRKEVENYLEQYRQNWYD